MKAAKAPSRSPGRRPGARAPGRRRVAAARHRLHAHGPDVRRPDVRRPDVRRADLRRHRQTDARFDQISYWTRAVVQWRRRRPRTFLAVVTAAVVLSMFSLGTAQAAFYKITATGANSWTTGTVAFSANSPASALFNTSSIKPGSTDTQCIKLTYSGTVAAQVHLYVSSLTGTGLGTYLTLQVNEGTGNNQSCSDFALTTNDYNPTGMSDTTKTLTTFAAASSNYGNGVSAWSTGSSTTKTYQFIWRMQGNNSGVNLTATTTFTWEADST